MQKRHETQIALFGGYRHYIVKLIHISSCGDALNSVPTRDHRHYTTEPSEIFVSFVSQCRPWRHRSKDIFNFRQKSGFVHFSCPRGRIYSAASTRFRFGPPLASTGLRYCPV